MSTTDPVAEFFRRVSAGDIDGAFSLVSDDVRWWVPGTLPFSGTKTKPEYMAIARQIQAGFPEGFRLELLDTTREGNKVAAEVESHGKHRNGRQYNNKYHFLLKVDGGKITEVKEYMDTLHLAQLIAP